MGKIGSTLDVRDSGEPERGDKDGGGVAETARGLAWLDVGGEVNGDEYEGDERPACRTFEERCGPITSSGGVEHSTSLRRD